MRYVNGIYTYWGDPGQKNRQLRHALFFLSFRLPNIQEK